MTRARLVVSVLVLTLLSGLLGCDVAVVAILASRSNKKNSNSTPSGPDLSFKLWVAELGAVAGSTEQGTIDGNNGDPDPARWTPLTSATTSGEYTMPTPKAGGFDSILIQATDAQVYEVDSFEVIDTTGTTIETAGATNTFCNSEITAIALQDAQGPPNGVGTLTNATSTKRSFIFMKRSTPITTFRINLWQQNGSRISGDVEWARSFNQTNDLAGGAALNSQGVIHIAFREAGNIWLLRYDQNGNIVQDASSNDLILLANGVTVSSSIGSQSVAIDKNHSDVVYFGLTRGAGDIQIQKFDKDITSPQWVPPLSISTTGIDRIERNGLAVTPNGSLVVVGGIDYGGTNGVGHFVHRYLSDRSDPWVAATPPTPPNDPNDTYWYGVVASSDQDFLLCGNATALVPPTDIDLNASRLQDLTPGGSITEKWNLHYQGATSHTALGRAIGVDGASNIYISGYFTNTDLDSVILRLDASSGSSTSHFTSNRTGNDELLDIAVEADGTIYATGYETNGAQGEDLVLYKIAANKAIVWKRTLDFANLADRGVKVMTTATHVIVIGQVGVAAGNLDIHVRKYVR